MMLNERHGVALTYDPQGDLATVTTTAGPAPSSRSVTGALLLDAAGFLVGVDLRDPNGRGVVVMLGPHEAVASTRDHAFEVHEDGAGEVAAVTLRDARKAIRAGEKNPYIQV